MMFNERTEAKDSITLALDIIRKILVRDEIDKCAKDVVYIALGLIEESANEFDDLLTYDEAIGKMYHHFPKLTLELIKHAIYN